jgi:hypothetical protein
MRSVLSLIAVVVAVALAGCLQTVSDERNAFLAFTETFGSSLTGDQPGGGGGGGGGGGATDQFRAVLTLTLVNNNPVADLNVGFAAWVEASSIRTAEQQDALISSGYVQLTREERIGSVFILAPGTFVFNGPGKAGTTPLLIRPGQSSVTSMITPDVVLIYQAPPVSCETPAFSFTEQGFPPDATTAGALAPGVAGGPIDADSSSLDFFGVKTLAQIDAYQCSPFRPGLFLKLSGGGRAANEFFEGEALQFDFVRAPDAEGNAAFVTVGG